MVISSPRRRKVFCLPRSQIQVNFWNKNRRIDQVLTILTNLCPYPQGKCTGWIFRDRIREEKKNISTTFLVGIQRQMQVCWLELSCRRSQSQSSWEICMGTKSVINTPLSHHLLSYNMACTCAYQCVYLCVFKAHLDINDHQVLAVLCNRHQGRFVFKVNFQTAY